MNVDEISTLLGEGDELRLQAKVDKADLQTLYAFAWQAVKRGDAKTAESLFRTLFHLDSWNFNYALSLGFCRQKRGAHEEALLCFFRAGAVEVTDPRPPYYAALSYQKLGLASCAKTAFSAVLCWASNQPQHQVLQQKAERALAELEI